MKDLSVISLKVGFFFIILLKITRLGVCSSVCFFLTIINPKMIPAKLLGPPDLPITQALHIYETTNVVIMSKNKDLVFATF